LGIYGRKPFVLGATALFLVGSMLSGLSQNMTQLIIFRAIQGLGGGAIFANAFAIVGDLFPPAERGRWQGLFGATFGLASVVGPLLGGWITDNASWRWIFYVNVPIGIVGLGVIWFLMPKIVPDIKNRVVDYLGAILLSLGLVSLLLALVWGGSQYPWISLEIISLLVMSLVSFLTFVGVERKTEEPVLPLELFKNPIFSVSSIVIFLTGIGMFGAILYVPLFAQLVLGVTATNSGTILTPMMLGMVGASIVSGQVVSRSGRYKVLAILGLGIAAIGLYLLSGMSVNTTQSGLVVRMILTGVGLGVTFPIFTLAVQNAFDHSKLGVATASTQLFRSVGATVGTAILGGVLNSSLAGKFGNLTADPFVQMVSKINPEFDLTKIDANKLQGLLGGDGRAAIEAQIDQLPAVLHTQAAAAFSDFVNKSKEVFASSVDQIFLIASVIIAISFLVSFALKEVPLRKTHEEDVLEEAGKELAVEEATIPAEDEPELE